MNGPTTAETISAGGDEASTVGVADVLANLGITPFPAPAQVQTPSDSGATDPIAAVTAALPALDCTALLKPITDLLATFGTGKLGGGSNPATTHLDIAGILENGVSSLLGAAKSIDLSWLGQAATSAVTTAVRTAGESGLVAAQ